MNSTHEDGLFSATDVIVCSLTKLCQL